MIQDSPAPHGSTGDDPAEEGSALDGLRRTLAADDYRMDVEQTPAGGVEVRISAGPDACADCLVPKPLMQEVLQNALGVSAGRIVLHYPGDDGAAG